MMDLCEFGPWWQDFSAWDDKLHAMTLDARRFCEDHKIPPCTIEEWSTLPQPSFILVNALDAVTLDYPEASGNAFTNRVLFFS